MKKIILAVICCLLMAVNATADSGPLEVASLEGITGFLVQAECLDRDVEVDGLYMPRIKKDIEKRLRRAGIKVYAEGEDIENKDAGILRLTVSAYRNANIDLYAFYIYLEVLQNAVLPRPPKATVTGVTWSRSYIGTVGDQHVESLAKEASSLAEMFIVDYLEANAW